MAPKDEAADWHAPPLPFEMQIAQFAGSPPPFIARCLLLSMHASSPGFSCSSCSCSCSKAEDPAAAAGLWLAAFMLPWPFLVRISMWLSNVASGAFVRCPPMYGV